MKKIISALFKFVFILLIIAIIYFALSGYMMYKLAISTISITDKVEQIINSDNYVTLDDMPDYYHKAVVAIEDKRYYEHGPIDITSILRAVLTNIKDRNFTEGGSSITQQLSKNLYFSQEKKLERKVAEVFLSYDLEKMYSKEKILELYINVIYYGDGYIGLYDACHGYFDKDPIDMTLYEATLLAGVPNAPSVYALSNGNTYIYERQQDVISCMISQGYLKDSDIGKIVKEGDD